ncbi:MAG: hypothetical protein KF745_12660 [Phycisphaeraceae bacterium]|nr:hypothetical protein [Phycisphaeraceae bacterium]
MDVSILAERVLREDILIPALIAGAIVLSILIKTVGSTIKSVAQERTRREIAAYIAEGSMSSEQGERLLRAGAKPPESCS